MVIRRINNVFFRHRRVLFGAITVIIIVTFMGFLTPGTMSMFSKHPLQQAVGSAFGEDITVEECREHALVSALVSSLQYGFDFRNLSLTDERMNAAFFELCMLAGAEQLGIAVSDDEIALFISKLPAFSENGKFSLDSYRNYVSKILVPNGFSMEDLDESVRRMLVVEKMQNELMDGVIVTPGEIKDFSLYMRLELETRVARFKAADYEKDVVVEDKELRNYFDSVQNLKDTPARYLTDATFTAEVLAFPYETAQNIAQAKERAKNENELKNFYEANKSLFTVNDQVKPYAEVAGEVKNKFIDSVKRELALDAARNFSNNAFEKLSEINTDVISVFNKIVAEAKLKTFNTGIVKAQDTVILGQQEPELIAELLKTNNLDVPMTNAVAGVKAAYVGFVVTSTPERPSTFEERQAEIVNDYKAIKAHELAMAAARNMVEKLKAQTPDMLEVMMKMNKAAKFERVNAFSVLNAPQVADGMMIAQVARTLPLHGISAAEDTADGALVVYLENCKVNNSAPVAKLEDIYQQNKFGVARNELLNWLNSNCQRNSGVLRD